MSLRTDKTYCLRPETRENSFGINVLPYDCVAAMFQMEITVFPQRSTALHRTAQHPSVAPPPSHASIKRRAPRAALTLFLSLSHLLLLLPLRTAISHVRLSSGNSNLPRCGAITSDVDILNTKRHVSSRTRAVAWHPGLQPAGLLQLTRQGFSWFLFVSGFAKKINGQRHFSHSNLHVL
ncbi:hypothetical protein KCU87_g484, partial [Aureobasidium melanogenum]